MSSERELYQPVRKALEKYFCEEAEECFFEVTADKVGERVEEKLADEVLFLIRKREFRPDIMGYVRVPIGLGIFFFSEFRVVVEVKDGKPSVNDLFQVKKYGELYDAAISILVSTDKPEQRFLRLLERKPTLLSLPMGGYSAFITRFLKDKCDFDWWYPRPPRES